MGKELTDAEFEELQAKATEAVRLAEEKEQLAKEKEDLAKEKEQLEKEINPNWKAIREKEKRLVKALKEQGKEVDDDGNLVEEKQLSLDDIRQAAREEAKREAIETRKMELLGEIEDEEQRRVIEHNFNKLTNGEDVSLLNIKTFMRQAVKASDIAEGNPLMDIIANSKGQPPRRTEVKQEVLDDTTANSLASQMGIGIDSKK